MQVPLIKETLEKLNDDKEEVKSKEPPKTLMIMSKMIDKNSIYAMTAAFPTSKIHTLRFNNNGLSYENCELLIQAIAQSNVNRLFFEWNPISEVPEGAESLFAKL
jgi:hypothetical protein